MDIAKKSYEISLWDEQLIWHRRKLQSIDNNSRFTDENPYTRGTYYVESGAQGTTTYELSYENYDSGKTYFELAELNDNNCIEAENAEGIKIDPINNPNWYENDIMVPNIIASYYKETRLCTIGSSSMESLARCVNPKLVSKVNGENTLTFTMYYQYIDTETGEKTYNPFIKYMVNERKVKLNYDGKWYDFVIKQIQENSETRAFTYTCKDQFMIELSKTGFDIVLDNELENNMGTVKQLAETILEGSDWRFAESGNLMQFVEEPLYKIGITAPLEAKNMITDDDLEWAKFDGETGTPLQYIYVFYSHINDQKEDLQFLYDASGKFETNDDLIIDKDKYPNYLIKGVKFNKIDSRGNVWPDFTASGSVKDSYDAAISSDYRGMRLVRQIQTKYDSTIDKFVQVYKKEGDENTIYYGFTDTEYVSPNAVSNLIVNPTTFTNTVGWYTEKTDGVRPILELTMDPPPTEYKEVNSPKKEDLPLYFEKEEGKDSYIKSTDTDIGEGKKYYVLQLNSSFISYLKLPANGSNSSRLMNSSINSYKSNLEEFVKGKTKFILRMKYKIGSIQNGYSGVAPSAQLGRYEFNATDDSYTFVKVDDDQDDILFNFTKLTNQPVTNETVPLSNYIYMEAVCNRSVSKSELKDWKNRYGLFFTFDGKTDIFIENVQLFPYLEYNDNLCVPGGELFSEVKTTQKYYQPSKTYTSIDDVIFEPAGGTYILQYNEGADAYTKVASITAKESNRFNLLQDLNEKFECWAHFNIEHNYDGSIKLGKDVGILTGDEAYRQQKFVSFHEYAGREEFNYASFRYGINSKSIQRTLDSNAIASKLIVKDNANEFAPNGFCSIARASENPTRENFLLNFDHYYRQKLLDLDVVTNDLYVDANGYLGYYKKLRQINKDRDANIDLQANLLKDIANYDSSYQTYKLSYDAAFEERQVAEDNIRLLIVPKEKRSDYADKAFEEIVATFASNWEEEESYIKNITKWAQCKNVETQHKPLYEKAKGYLDGAKAQFDSISAQLKEQTEQKRALNLQFYKKYSRFIQEGSWLKEDYVDDNLYYLDSVSTLHTSAQPKVTYNISVIDISQIPGFEGYVFELGDKTYIEDVEFFGYSLIDREAPYREEIVVSEMTFELDSPEKNRIKVQNYKTQFEDLFQRIAAQTQQAEYYTGEYKRAASIVEADGTIALSTLENSFSNNSLRLQNARDQSVVIDEYGITSTSLANPSEMVRIVAGGIFMSTDGGTSWKTGLTGHGLNSSYLTAGLVNADEINIMSDSQPAFRWDAKGLSAYSYETDETDQMYNYNTKKYVRFDRFGIYGIENETEGMVLNSVSSVMSNAAFALTWNGFSLRNSDGSVKITSSDDIQVLSGENERIKIGRIDKGIYGIRISDNNGKSVMVTGSDGKLWLKSSLIVGNGEQGSPTVQIGYITDTTNSNGAHAVIKAGNGEQQFIAYEDGHVFMAGAEVSGTIKSDKGQIGCMAVDGKVLKIIGPSAENKVVITEAGIEVVNAGFNIKIGDQDVFSIRDQKLIMTGEINATSGRFSGNLEAPLGNIGGFLLSEDQLISSNGNIVLNGAAGSIVADDITLGTSAKIAEYIQLGNAYIRNPNKQAGKFIEASGLAIYDNGLFKIGEGIVLDGPNENIRSKNFSSGSAGWKVGQDSAEFNEVTVRGILRSSVFSYDEIQAVGGMMLVRPSSTIRQVLEKDEEIWVVVDDPNLFYPGAVCEVARTKQIYKVLRKNENKLCLGSLREGIKIEKPERLDILTSFLDQNQKTNTALVEYEDVQVDGARLIIQMSGNYELADDELRLSEKEEREEPSLFFDNETLKIAQTSFSNNVGIAINSSNSSATYPQQAITIFESTIDDDVLIKTPHIKIGKMSGEDPLSGYGLWADNVYLNGRLVTGSEFSSNFSGFDGHSKIGEMETKGETKILLWAGAASKEETDIKTAPFRVDNEGNLYANKGRFSGAVISDSTISAVRIETATLVGKGSGPALRIIDTSEGIEFCDRQVDGENENLATTFRITHSGQQIGLREDPFSFIDLSDNDVAFKTKPKPNGTSIVIKNNSIKLGSFSLISEKSAEKDSVVLKTNELDGPKLEFDSISRQISLESSSVEYGEKMRYSKAEEGYDLYVF